MWIEGCDIEFESSAMQQSFTNYCYKLQEVLLPLWATVAMALEIFWQEGCGGDRAPCQHRWTIQAARHIMHIAPGVLAAGLQEWVEMQPVHVPTGGAEPALVEMCLIYSVAWALRGARGCLTSCDEEKSLEASILSAFQRAGFRMLPKAASLWDSCIDASNVTWTTWERSGGLSILQPFPESCTAAAHLLTPTTAVVAAHSLLGHIVASGGAALVLCPHSQELSMLQHGVRHCMGATHGKDSVQCISITGCSALHAAHVQVRELAGTTAMKTFNVSGAFCYVIGT
jgi:hypothetical protein